ncbi:MAG: S8 family serine peptidase [Armatimonadota bacterium]|nr:S8 family serine peptidase [Armatimonadota bacterium]
MEQIAAIRQEKGSWTPAQRKIESKLLLAAKKNRQAPLAIGMPELRSSIELDSENKVLVDVRAVVTDQLITEIKALGGDVINSLPQYHAIRARLPIIQVETLAAKAAVRSIRPADVMFTNKTNTTQGDVAHRAYAARSAFGIDGTGVKVGVISDSVDYLATVQSSGDLPGAVTVLSGQSGNPGSSEGTAMLEIVYDLAPGAELYFATANGGEANFANNVLALQSAGCNVIVDDVGYFAEPVFQDGIIAQAVETVCAAGARYFSAAGNSGNENDGTSGVWEGDYVPMAVPPAIGYGTAQSFGGSNSDLITVDSPSFFTLQWSDPMGGSANDYDLYLLDSTLTTVLDGSAGWQTGIEDPFEIIDSRTRNDAGNRLVIVKYSGNARYMHLNANRGRLSVNTAGQTWGHSAAASAYSVAAVDVATAGGGIFTGGPSNPVETYSSDGPRRVFYVANGTPITPGNFSSTGGAVRQKPDLAAADGVATATPPAAWFNPFYGTSAAAPHAAAIAALLLDYKPIPDAFADENCLRGDGAGH